ncbi:MAG: O-antigen ligase family protein [Hellea sp.]|nr:O-antigen ligase family protein [Hellea sp.]
MVSMTYDDMLDQQRSAALWRLFKFLETCLFIFLIIFYSGAFVGLLFTHSNDIDAADNPMARLLWYPVYVLVALLCVRSLPQVIRSAAFSPLIILCVMWCGISMLWSEIPAVTFRRTIALGMGTILGFALAARYDWGQLVQRIALAFLILAVISVLTAVLWPVKGLMQEIHHGAWRGPWVEKNYLGGNMTKGLVAMMCAFAMRPDRWWLWVPAGVLCYFLVIMSTSKTALLVSTASIGLFVAIRVFRRFPVLRIPVMYFSVMALSFFLVAILAFPEEVFGLLGKDPTLTGRTEIWSLLIESIKERFTLGYGFGVYWQDELGPSYDVRKILEWGVPTAHNGWIEIWLSGGVVIVALFGLQYIITLLLAINRLGRGGVETYWVILSTLMFLFFSMSESTILAQNDLTWVMFVATAAKLFAFERPYWRDGRNVPFHQPRQL